jgi:hypothetical protein
VLNSSNTSVKKLYFYTTVVTHKFSTNDNNKMTVEPKTKPEDKPAKFNSKPCKGVRIAASYAYVEVNSFCTLANFFGWILELL